LVSFKLILRELHHKVREELQQDNRRWQKEDRSMLREEWVKIKLAINSKCSRLKRTN
jgi:hypothetical protein